MCVCVCVAAAFASFCLSFFLQIVPLTLPLLPLAQPRRRAPLRIPLAPAPTPPDPHAPFSPAPLRQRGQIAAVTLAVSIEDAREMPDW